MLLKWFVATSLLHFNVNNLWWLFRQRLLLEQTGSVTRTRIVTLCKALAFIQSSVPLSSWTSTEFALYVRSTCFLPTSLLCNGAKALTEFLMALFASACLTCRIEIVLAYRNRCPLQIPDPVVLRAAHMAAKMEAEVTERASQKRQRLIPVLEELGSEKASEVPAGNHEQTREANGNEEPSSQTKQRPGSSSLEDEKARMLLEHLRKLPSTVGRKEEFLERLQELVKA